MPKNEEHLAAVRQPAQWRQHPIRWAELQGSSLPEADLRGLTLQDANLRSADLYSANLEGADLDGADLTGANLIAARLAGASLRNTILEHANLSRANMRHAVLSSAALDGATMRRAYLVDTVIQGCSMYGTDLSEATVGGLILAETDLSHCVGLDTVEHSGPSTIGIDTLQRSSNQIPKSFIRGCGIDDLFMTYAHEIVDSSAAYYSPFISYSHSDNSLANKIYGDLFFEHRIPCWKDNHNIRPGESIAGRIRRGVRDESDKMLLLCSEDSLSSEWVDDELDTLFELERQLGRSRRRRRAGSSRVSLLIPVDTDGFLFSDDCDHEWKARITSRRVVDLKEWRKPERLRTGLAEILDALRIDDRHTTGRRGLW